MSRQNSPSNTRWGWLLWILVALVAVGLRLYRLNAAPLTAQEATRALTALHLADSPALASPTTAPKLLERAWRTPDLRTGSPSLVGGEALLFFLFGPGDGTARLLSALLGVALTLAPWLWRRRLGEGRALMMGALLALSPTATFLSRQLDGAVAAALGTLLLVIGLDQALAGASDGGAQEFRVRGQGLSLATVGAVLSLTASPLAYTGLLAAGAALALATSLRWTRSDGALPDLAVWVRPYGLAFGAGFLLLTTAFLWWPAGLGEGANLPLLWLRGFLSPDPEGLSLGRTLALLVVYEPLILFLALVAVEVALVRWAMAMPLDEDRPFALLALWAGGALLLALLRTGRTAGDLLMALVPLAGLGSGVAIRPINALVQKRDWEVQGLYLAVALVGWLYFWFTLSSYAAYPQQTVRLVFALLALILLFSLIGAFAFVVGWLAALRGALLSTTVALAFYTFFTGWGAAQRRPADPAELLHVAPTAPEVRDLVVTLYQLADEEGQELTWWPITVLDEAPGSPEEARLRAQLPLLAWYLRPFPEARLEGPSPALTPSVVITVNPEPPLGERYVGRDFPLQRRWTAPNLGCVPVSWQGCDRLVRWLTFRRLRGDSGLQESPVYLWRLKETRSRGNPK